jgi:hypothetical protein
LLQTLLRDRPAHVRSAVLDSVVPIRPDDTSNELDARCIETLPALAL